MFPETKKKKQAELDLSYFSSPGFSSGCCLGGDEVTVGYETAAEEAEGSQKPTSQATLVTTEPCKNERSTSSCVECKRTAAGTGIPQENTNLL